MTTLNALGFIEFDLKDKVTCYVYVLECYSYEFNSLSNELRVISSDRNQIKFAKRVLPVKNSKILLKASKPYVFLVSFDPYYYVESSDLEIRFKTEDRRLLFCDFKSYGKFSDVYRLPIPKDIDEWFSFPLVVIPTTSNDCSFIVEGKRASKSFKISCEAPFQVRQRLGPFNIKKKSFPLEICISNTTRFSIHSVFISFEPASPDIKHIQNLAVTSVINGSSTYKKLLTIEADSEHLQNFYGTFYISWKTNYDIVYQSSHQAYKADKPVGGTHSVSGVLESCPSNVKIMEEFVYTASIKNYTSAPVTFSVTPVNSEAFIETQTDADSKTVLPNDSVNVEIKTIPIAEAEQRIPDLLLTYNNNARQVIALNHFVVCYAS